MSTGDETADPTPADPKKVLSDEEITEQIGDLDGWALSEGSLTITAECESPEAAADLFSAIARAANNQNHHPDVLWSYTEITLDLASHDVEGITSRDIRLARTVTDLVADFGATPLGL